jgi:hypothetical protein
MLYYTMNIHAIASCASAILLATGTTSAVTLFQVDDFSNGIAGWVEGNPSPDPPIATGIGTDGSPFLRNDSSGGGGPGSRMAMFNDLQWTGNYIESGISAIRLEAGTFGPDTINLRLAFNGAGGWFTTDAVPITNNDPGNPQWQTLIFSIMPGDLAHVAQGNGSYAETMSNVTRMEIYSGGNTLSAGSLIRGEAINSSLLLDQIQAIPEPSSIVLLMITAFAALARRKRVR